MDPMDPDPLTLIQLKLKSLSYPQVWGLGPEPDESRERELAKPRSVIHPSPPSSTSTVFLFVPANPFYLFLLLCHFLLSSKILDGELSWTFPIKLIFILSCECLYFLLCVALFSVQRHEECNSSQLCCICGGKKGICNPAWKGAAVNGKTRPVQSVLGLK
jgi:hypothetical protein